MKKIITLLFLAVTLSAAAQDFNHYFEDATLRLDYIFSGNAKHQAIAVDELSRIPRWYGKHERLAEVPVEGNGQVIVRDHRTQKVIYRNSFSTLFQEWLTYDEAKKPSGKAFENVFLVPFPKDSVDITVELRNNRREVTVSMSHTVNPKDILIRHIGERSVTPYETLQKAADTTRCIHIAYVAEGYTEAEMANFIEDCRTANEALFAHEPFKSLRQRFNVVAVKSPSMESGTSEPSKGIWKNTALHSHFDTFYSDRYLTTLHLKELHDWLAGTPYEHIIVLVNTEKYGGGGIPWEPNLTTLVDFHGKWENLINKKTPIPTPQPADLDKPNARYDKWKVGVYEPAGYSQHGVYRAYPDCRMRTNMHPEFCPACNLGLTKLIKFYTGE